MGLKGIDEAFVQAPEHRPQPSITEAEGIPLIDLSRGIDDEDLVRQIGSACKQWGFFQVINHGVPAEKRQRIEEAARVFFMLPLEEKRKVGRDKMRVLGYYDSEYTKNVRDWKEIFDISVGDPTFLPGNDGEGVAKWTNQWPEKPADFREACEEYVKEMKKLCDKLMGLIALSLGLPVNRFSGLNQDQSSIFKLNHYPPCPIPHLALGLGRHKDASVLTVLAQNDVGGLEVKRKTDGEWILVKPTSNAFIINVGDIIQVWSNERYESVEHRAVVNSERERLSIAFFLSPAYSTMIKPLEELTDEQNPPKYRPFNWGKFVTTRKGNKFRKLEVENIQIHDFRVSE